MVITIIFKYLFSIKKGSSDMDFIKEIIEKLNKSSKNEEQLGTGKVVLNKLFNQNLFVEEVQQKNFPTFSEYVLPVEEIIFKENEGSKRLIEIILYNISITEDDIDDFNKFSNNMKELTREQLQSVYNLKDKLTKASISDLKRFYEYCMGLKRVRTEDVFEYFGERMPMFGLRISEIDIFKIDDYILFIPQINEEISGNSLFTLYGVKFLIINSLLQSNYFFKVAQINYIFNRIIFEYFLTINRIFNQETLGTL